MSGAKVDWKKQLSAEQYRVLRQKGTEVPGSGKYILPASDGVYHCVACGNLLFTASDQYESTTPGLIGWPSFSEAASKGAVELRDDDSMGMHRTEVVCAKCGGHLGHLFDDESSPNGQHYCINSICLDLSSEKN